MTDLVGNKAEMCFSPQVRVSTQSETLRESLRLERARKLQKSMQFLLSEKLS